MLFIMKWEYVTRKAKDLNEEMLNALGEESWDLVCIYDNLAVFKRRKAEEKTEQVIIEDADDKALFEECWIAYNRRGSKALAKAQWSKLSTADKSKVLPHIKEYVASVSEVRYQVYFERYLRDKRFLDMVHGAKPQTLFSEPQQTKQTEEKLIIGNTEYR
jgi:hypothetical protein